MNYIYLLYLFVTSKYHQHTALSATLRFKRAQAAERKRSAFDAGSSKYDTNTPRSVQNYATNAHRQLNERDPNWTMDPSIKIIMLKYHS